jgi:hypothetical protein
LGVGISTAEAGKGAPHFGRRRIGIQRRFSRLQCLLLHREIVLGRADEADGAGTAAGSGLGVGQPTPAATCSTAVGEAALVMGTDPGQGPPGRQAGLLCGC